MRHDEPRDRFEALVAEVHDPLARYLARRASPGDAEEVLGDVLLVLWRRLDDVPDRSPLPWCYGVARRSLANRRRSTRRRTQLTRRLETQRAARYDEAGAHEYPELVSALAALPDRDRELIRLWAWEGLEPHEIAAAVGATPNAVSLRLSRAKKKLAQHIARQSGAGAGHKGLKDTGASP